MIILRVYFLDIVGKIPSNSKVICSLWIQKWFVKRYRNLTWRRLQYLLPLAVCQTLYPTMLAAQTRKTSLQSLPVLLLLWNCKTEEMKRKITDYQLWRIAGDNFCLQPMFVRDLYPCQDTDVLQMDDDFLYVFPFPMFVIFFVLGTRLEAMACGITTLRRSTKWQQSRCDDFQCHNGKLWQTAPWIQGLYLYGNAIREMCVYGCSCGSWPFTLFHHARDATVSGTGSMLPRFSRRW